jgi:UDP-glucose:(heptosyl)LPS alpha-1,3-glucosyltransferase
LDLMHVLFAIERMDLSRGGRETYTSQVASALAQRGCRVTVVCQSASWSAPGVEVVALGRRGRTGRQRLARFAADARRTWERASADVVHAMLPLPGATVYHLQGGTIRGQTAAGLRRRRAFTRLAARAARAVNPVRRLAAALERRVIADSRIGLVCVSRLVADELRTYYGRTENVHVLANAVNTPSPADPLRAEWRLTTRAALGASDADPVFIAVATNFALKGVAECIEAFAHWREDRPERHGARLIVAGRAEVDAYLRLARHRGVNAHVRFVPPTNEIFRWYAAADAAILLTWYDPCSLVVLEAARWGIPSITTAYNGAVEALDPGAVIVVRSPRDIEGVVGALEELADPPRREARVATCQRLADRLSLERHVDGLLALYADLARR